jgi:4-oxalmesaconate hydratase
MQLIQGDLFKDFPDLKFVIPHGGGAVPFHWGRYRGLCLSMQKKTLPDHLLKNVFFDTCVYHLPGIRLMTEVVPIDNILFASEMKGAVPGIDPETGHYFDDTKRYVDQVEGLSDADRHKIFEGNARRVYPRLDALLKKRGK